MSDTPLVDWKNDESVVRAAKPGSFLFFNPETNKHEGIYIPIPPYMREWVGTDWHDARTKHPTVVAFEAAHNPAQLPALPEETGFEEWWSDYTFGLGGGIEHHKESHRNAYNAALSRRAQPQDASETVTWRVKNFSLLGKRFKDHIFASETDARNNYEAKSKNDAELIRRVETVVAQRKAGA